MLKKKQIIRTTLALAIAGASIGASADPARDYGGQGKSLGQQLMEKMNPPASPGGGGGSSGGGHNSKFTFDLGNGQSITMDSSELAPDEDGMYLEKPSLGELQGVYDSDYDMDTMGRAAQGKLYQDAQNMGNPFDPDPEKRKLAGPSSISGSAYQVVLGVSEARNYYGDMSNDPIIAKADEILGDEDLLSDFGDCSVATELTETSRLAHLPDEQTCTRVLAPAASSCQVRHEIVVESEVVGDAFTVQMWCEQIAGNGKSVRRRCMATPPGGARIVVEMGLPLNQIPRYVVARFNEIYGAGACRHHSERRVFDPGRGISGFYYGLTCNSERTVYRVSQDRWYPEECIQRANRQ